MIAEESKKSIGIDIGIILLGIVLFFTPFFRGLYFEKEMYRVITALSVVFSFIVIKNIKSKEKINIHSLMQYFGIAFVFTYLINFPFAINKSIAVYEVIKNVTYIILFMIISNIIKNDKQISFLNWIFILSGVVVSIIGFGSSFGTFSYKGAFEAGMINSTFQYHNTFGAYMLGVLVLSIGEISESKSFKNYILSGISYILFIGLIFSYSRGAWLLLPLAALIMFILLDNIGLKRVSIATISIILGFGVSFSNVYKAVNSNLSSGWTFIIVGFLVSVIVSLILDKSSEKLPNINIKKKYIAITIIGVTVVLGGLFLSGTLTKYLPESVSQRLTSINLKTFTVVERNVFYKDALKVVKDYFIIGTGGGGWEALYPQYQTYEYTTTQTHNYLMQVFVEVGILGLIFLIGLYLSTLYSSFNIIRNSKDNRTIGVITAVIVLVIHTFIDFDMSLSSYALLIWALLGIIASKDKEIESKFNVKLINTNPLIAGVLSIIVLITSGMFNMGTLNYNKGLKEYKSENYEETITYFEKASKYKPFEVDYKLDLSSVQNYVGLSENKDELVQKSKENMDKLLEINERDLQTLVNATRFYLQYGDIDKGIELTDKSVQYYPLRDDAYTHYINVYYTLGTNFVNKDRAKAKEYLEKIVEMDKNIIQLNQELDNRKNTLLKDVQDVPESYVNDRFKINISEKSTNQINQSKILLNSL
ncbi:O-antigen ligase family protein [Tepidibacter sp. Z1-5]|uniref:O-antigen ligase family protein n=1 Tax=Tepidibacter sp. Z1-5 TaxID=3134138 RepID=UPI0030C56CE8